MTQETPHKIKSGAVASYRIDKELAWILTQFNFLDERTSKIKKSQGPRVAGLTRQALKSFLPRIHPHMRPEQIKRKIKEFQLREVREELASLAIEMGGLVRQRDKLCQDLNIDYDSLLDAEENKEAQKRRHHA